MIVATCSSAASARSLPSFSPSAPRWVDTQMAAARRGEVVSPLAQRLKLDVLGAATSGS